jgi:transcription elongation GreA/GreB family factor
VGGGWRRFDAGNFRPKEKSEVCLQLSGRGGIRLGEMEGIDQFIETHELSPHIADKLRALTPGTYCYHKSWGVGRITGFNSAKNAVTLDFKGKTGHPMQLEYAAESLAVLPPDDLRVRCFTELAKLREAAKEGGAARLGLIENAIESLGVAATANAIETLLSPEIVPASDWKKWWDAAKREMRKHGGFIIPTGKSSAFSMKDPGAAQGVDYSQLGELVGLKQLMTFVQQVLKQDESGKGDNASEKLELLTKVENALRKAPPSQKDVALRLALVRDQLAESVGQTVSEDISTVKLVGAADDAVRADVLSVSTASDQARMFEAIKTAEPSMWHASILDHLSQGTARMAGAIRDFFKENDAGDKFTEALRRGIREQSLSSEVLIWLFKQRKGELAPLCDARSFSALIAAIERDQIGDRRSAKLHDLVLSDKTLLTDLLAGSSLETVRDVTRALMLSTVFDEMDKRSLLGRLVKAYPEMQDLVSQSADKSGRHSSEAAKSAPAEKLIVSWDSLARRKAEYEDLINKQIPANTQEISVARSYGDLRENAEFKFAKEQQRVLSKRRAELEADISRAEGTDFKETDSSRVSIGTVVTVRESGGDELTYTILGAWDSDPEKRVISYLTPIAKALLGHATGEEVALADDGGAVRRVTIVSIKRYAA